MNEEKQFINIDGNVYDPDDLSQDLKNNLVALQTGSQGIQILQSLMLLAQKGSEELLRTTKKQLPPPVAPEQNNLTENVEVSDETQIQSH